MNTIKLITSYQDFTNNLILEGLNSENYVESMDQSIIEKLVDMVGDESDVEDAAKESFEELQKSFERGELEVDEMKSAETLAITSLVLKLVENGKLDPLDADDFLENTI